MNIIKKNIIPLCYCFILFVINAQSSSVEMQRLIPSGHWVYDAVIRIEAETGKASFAQNAPLSTAELLLYLDEIDFDSLSEAGKHEYSSIMSFFNKDYLSFGSHNLSLGIDPLATIEFYHKAEDDISWNYSSHDKKHILDLPVIIGAGDFLCVESVFFAGLNYWAAEENGVFTNIPYKSDAMDAHFPSTAYISAGLPIYDIFTMNFQLGKGNLSVGRTQLGSIFLSDYSDHDAYALFSLYSQKIRYAAAVIQLEVNKNLYLHRLEFMPYKKIQIGLHEGVLVNAPLELRYLNPLAIFHNYAAWRTYGKYNNSTADGSANTYDGFSRVGSYFGLTFDINPWRFMRFYGLFAMNQFQTAYERETYPESAAKIPDSLGFQGGIETFVPFKKGYFYGGIEGLYTNPWLYICDDVDWSFYRSRYDLIKNTNVPVHTWVGSPYGPDTLGFSGKAGYEVVSQWAAHFSYKTITRGEHSFALFSLYDASGKNNYYPSSVEEATQKSPTGIAEVSHSFTVSGSYSPLPWIDISSQVGYTVVTNSKHVEHKTDKGFEFVISCSISLP